MRARSTLPGTKVVAESSEKSRLPIAYSGLADIEDDGALSQPRPQRRDWQRGISALEAKGRVSATNLKQRRRRSLLAPYPPRVRSSDLLCVSPYSWYFVISTAP